MESMRTCQPRDYLASKPSRAEMDAPLAHRDVKIGDRNLSIPGRPRAAEIGNLVISQDRAVQDIPQPPFRQMHDLGEDGIRFERFLCLEVTLYLLMYSFVTVTESSEKASARRSTYAANKHPKITL